MQTPCPFARFRLTVSEVEAAKHAPAAARRARAQSGREDAVKVIATNRKARHDYHILETMETGIVLVGTEVKSLREGAAHLKDSYAAIDRGELYLHNAHISPYSKGNRYNHEALRKRKLLAHAGEIRRLMGKVKEKGFTLVPLRLYFNDAGKVKVEIGLAKGKREIDKRRTIAERDAERELRREIKERDRKK